MLSPKQITKQILLECGAQRRPNNNVPSVMSTSMRFNKSMNQTTYISTPHCERDSSTAPMCNQTVAADFGNNL